MAHGARVSSIQSVRDFRAALCTFIDEAGAALNEAYGEVKRVDAWLRGDQQRSWQQQIKRRARKLAEAKSELARAELASRDERPSCVLERRAVAKAEAAHREAQEKLKNGKRWATALEREDMLFRGQCQSLATVLHADLPKAAARMERMIMSLEAYVAEAPLADGSVGAIERDPDRAAESKGRVLHRSPLAALRRATPSPAQRRRLLDEHLGELESTREPRFLELRENCVAAAIGASEQPIVADDTIILEEAALTAPQVFLERVSPVRADDSGWFAGVINDGEAVETNSEQLRMMTVKQVLQERSMWGDFLSLPGGHLVVLDGDAIQAVLDPDNHDVWSDRL